MKKLLLTILFCLFISTAYAYTIKVQTINDSKIYKNVASYEFLTRYLKMTIWDGTRTKEIYINRWDIIDVEIDNDF